MIVLLEKSPWYKVATRSAPDFIHRPSGISTIWFACIFVSSIASLSSLFSPSEEFSDVSSYDTLNFHVVDLIVVGSL